MFYSLFSSKFYSIFCSIFYSRPCPPYPTPTQQQRWVLSWPLSWPLPWLSLPFLRQGPPRQDRPEIGGVPDGPTRLDGLLSSCRREDGRGQMRSGSWDGSEGQRRDRLWQQHYITQTKLRLKQTKQNINKLEYCKWSRYSIVLNSH